MGYKTFEDMKHNIPEGATHYRDECESFLFTWFKETDSGIKFYEEVSQNWSLIGRHVNNIKSKMVKIPSQIETPEEKEALDMINTTSKQVESLVKGDEVEWKNGDSLLWKNGNGEFLECNAGRYIGYDSVENKHIFVRTDVDTYYIMYAKHSAISKPESQEQKAERERLEIVKKACLTVRHDYGLMGESDRNFLEKYGMEWLKAFEKLGCIKDSK